MATAAGSRSWALLAALGLAAAVNPTGCSKDGPAGAGSVDLEALRTVLATVGPEVVVPALLRFQDAGLDLVEATEDWGDAVATGTGEAEQEVAQEAWLLAFAAWQEVELLQLGPAGSSLTALGGEDVRDEVYSWPTVSGCKVDQVTVTADYESDDFFTASLVNSYGLDATEHLLFYEVDNDCPSQVDINAEGSWDALGDDGVRQRRAAYAQVLSEGLVDQSDLLLEAWSPEGGDFSGSLASGSAPYASEQEALNAVYDALFYLETMTKDRKLDHLLGGQDCGTETCPEDAEAITSGAGLLAIEANLVGFRTLFSGGSSADGLDDLLVELGHGDLSQSILAATDAALETVGGMEGALDELMVTEPEAVQALHDDIKAIADLLKGDLATVLAVQIPAEATGDND